MHAWRARHSFASVWRVDWDKDKRERVLRFWLRAAREDDWTFQELRRFIGWMIDEGRPLPVPLQAWANEVAAGRLFFDQTRTGPKTDHRRDYQMLVGAIFFELCRGRRPTSADPIRPGSRGAYRRLAKLFHCSPSTARDAVERASKWPPGAWSGNPQK